MAYRVGWVPAVAILLSIDSTPATATTQVICNQILLTGAEISQCSNGTVDEYTDPNLGVQGVTGTAETLADLRTGSLHSRTVAQAYRSGTYDLATSANSIAQLQDTITIGGGYAGPVGITMEVSGAFSMNVPNALTGGLVSEPGVSAYLQTNRGAVDLGSAGAFVEQVNNGGNDFVVRLVSSSLPTQGATASTNADAATGQFIDPADVRIVLSTSFFVTPSTPTFTVFARLGTHTAFPPRSNPLADQVLVSELDFGNSAHLSLILPEGVTWTSGSGVFLAGVPEPGTAALWAEGMLCLAVVRRARAKSARASTRSLRAGSTAR